jgi:hypothetical protein
MKFSKKLLKIKKKTFTLRKELFNKKIALSYFKRIFTRKISSIP